MTLEQILDIVVQKAPIHLQNYIIDETKDIDVVGLILKLGYFVRDYGFGMFDYVVPGATLELAEEWAKVYAISLFMNDEILPVKDTHQSVLIALQNTIAQVYEDLLIDGEVREARLHLFLSRSGN